MCIIAVIPKAESIDKETFNRCWDTNPDGGGMSYVKDGKIITFKSMKKKKFRAEYFKLIDQGVHQTSPFILHFRIATHGTVNLENVHPFKLENHEMVMAHNGIIQIDIPSHKKHMSDTRYYIEHYLEGLPAGFHQNESIRKFMVDTIGYSKLVFMDSLGHVQIINSHYGVWEGKTWYSNTAYKPHVNARYAADPRFTYMDDDYLDFYHQTDWTHWNDYTKAKREETFSGTYYEYCKAVDKSNTCSSVKLDPLTFTLSTLNPDSPLEDEPIEIQCDNCDVWLPESGANVVDRDDLLCDICYGQYLDEMEETLGMPKGGLRNALSQ